MPTEPLDTVLYRDLAVVAAKDVIDVASPLLRELVNHATNALVRGADSLDGKVDEDLALLALYRQTIEMTDGIEVMISQSCAIPAIPLIRSNFEALLAIEYILENSSTYVQRSLSWLVGYVHQRIETYERLDPRTEKGREFTARVENDFVVPGFTLPEHFNVPAAIANLEAFLNKEHIRPIEREWQRKKRPNWYQLFDGPSNLWYLASYLKRGGQYDLLYRYWSRIVHAQDLLSSVTNNSGGDGTLRPLRQSEELGTVAAFAAFLMLSATIAFLRKTRPGENLALWYKREIQKSYGHLAGTAPDWHPEVFQFQ